MGSQKFNRLHSEYVNACALTWRVIQAQACLHLKSIFTHISSTVFYYYHLIDTSAGGLLVPEAIICPEVSASPTDMVH